MSRSACSTSDDGQTFPRLGLATSASGPDPSPAVLAVLSGLKLAGPRVQHFRSCACPTLVEAVGQVTGLPDRHLDGWLMPEEVLRQVFLRGAADADLSIIEGTCQAEALSRPCPFCDRPGDLRPVAEALGLPIVAVISCEGQENGPESFHLPLVPPEARAVLLSDVSDLDRLPWLKRLVRMTTGLPVIGAVESLPEVRAALERTPHDGRLPEELIEPLARGFLRHSDLNAFHELARSRSFPRPPGEGPPRPLVGSRKEAARFRVAYARDAAFNRYFPDTIEAFEALGADLVEFSPLRDERLPEDVGLVVFGCGFPDQFAAELAANHSMIAALRIHVCLGRRIYSEGGGTAYLGRRLIVEGAAYNSAGILPFDAEFMPRGVGPVPVERELIQDSWLGPKGTVVRGYRSDRWRLAPGAGPPDCPNCSGPLTAEGDWFYHHHAVGSLLHLHLGALPEVVAAFAGPHRPSLRRPITAQTLERDRGATRPNDLER